MLAVDVTIKLKNGALITMSDKIDSFFFDYTSQALKITFSNGYTLSKSLNDPAAMVEVFKIQEFINQVMND